MTGLRPVNLVQSAPGSKMQCGAGAAHSGVLHSFQLRINNLEGGLMRRRQLILAAIAGTAIFAGCTQTVAPAAPAVDLAAEAQAVRDRSAAWLQLAVARDAAGIVNGVYTPDAVTMYDGEVHKGTAALQASFEAEVAAMPNSTISWSTTDVKVASSGDLAYELGTFTFDPDGAGPQPAANGEFVTVWTKVDGAWRVAADAGTRIKPPEAAPAQ